MHLVLIVAMVFVSIVKAQGELVDCSNYEEVVLKRFSVGPFISIGGGGFRSGELLYRGPQDKELYLSDFFDVSHITSGKYTECEEMVTLRDVCWVDTFTVKIYSNGVVVERGQTVDWYLVSGEDVDLNSEIAIGDSKERVLEVLGKPKQMAENRWLYACIAEGTFFEETIADLRFVDDRLALISVYVYTGECLE
ncbi:hypothetical protein CHISP_3735 [Chitinispirillum alkaliphilum]|nr:hypothetical protein CHISP_3735 [Chitinispirillum alkaliphilum]